MSTVLPFTWTDEAHDKLQTLWATGMPYEDIAIALSEGVFHVTRNMINGKVVRMGLSTPRKQGRPLHRKAGVKPKASTNKLAAVDAMAGQGKTAPEIANALQLDPDYVSYRLKLWRVEHRNEKVPPLIDPGTDQEFVRALLAAGGHARLSERFIGYEPRTNRRKYAACLPMVWPDRWAA